MAMLIAVGVVMKTRGKITDEGQACLTNVVIDVIIPCNIIMSFIGQGNLDKLMESLPIIGLSALMMFLSVVIGKICFRRMDPEIRKLVEELLPIGNLRYLNLTENRGISNEGMAAVGKLKQLRFLNIGACDINNQGLAFLPGLTNLEYLNLSYCNRITEKAAPFIQKLPKLKDLDLQGGIKINTGGLKKFEKA